MEIDPLSADGQILSFYPLAAVISFGMNLFAV
jgi:hypothetical protein